MAQSQDAMKMIEQDLLQVVNLKLTLYDLV